ncbi:MAG: DUF1269 domain-containing protein [Pseudomonadota bacterium]
MKRLCFLSPDETNTRHLVNDLQANGIPEERIYVVAREGVQLEGLPDAGQESDDFLPAYLRGVAIGGAGGLIAGLLAMAMPVPALPVSAISVLLFGLYGAGFGGLLAGLAGASYHSSRLSAFEPALEQGKLLVIVELPRHEITHYTALVRNLYPEVEVIGPEPHGHLIPRG